MKNILTVLLIFLTALMYGQLSELQLELADGIEFAEKDSVTHYYRPRKINRNFKKSSLIFKKTYYLVLDSLNRIKVKENKARYIIFFKKNGYYKFYNSKNFKKLSEKVKKRGRAWRGRSRLSNYPEKSAITKLYNRMLQTAARQNMPMDKLKFYFLDKTVLD